MFIVLIPLPHLRYSEPRLVCLLPMERRPGRGPYAAWDYDQRDIAIHPERWDYRDSELTLVPSWDPCWGPFQ